MKVGLVGLPQSGKSTIFAALSGAKSEQEKPGSSRTELRIATTTVPDDRIQFLEKLFKPQKTTYAAMEFLLAAEISTASASKSEGGAWNQIRVCDALLHVVRNFSGMGKSPPTPEKDFWRLEEEMIISDLMVAEKRIQRIEQERRKGKKPERGEDKLLRSCHELLEQGHPLRSAETLASDPALRGFTLLSAKPVLVVVNNDDEDESLPQWRVIPKNIERIVVRGRLERDLAALPPEEAEEFRDAYHLRESALNALIAASYRLLNRITFFTVLSDEVRAWPITAGTQALEAAGTVHSDMKKGFIRAEVLPFEDLKKYGSFQEARKVGQVRLEGKEYIVRDGDIINFRFSL